MNEASRQQQLGQDPVPQPPATPSGQAPNGSTPPGKSGVWIALAIVAAVLLLAGAIFYLAVMPNGDSPSEQLNQPETNLPTNDPNVNNQNPEQQADTAEDSNTTAPKTYEISYTNACFSPANQAIKVGDTIKFINNSSNDMWPASNDHPSHTIYPEFDPQQAISPGNSWSFTFTKTGTWGYHDHLRDACEGTITVQ